MKNTPPPTKSHHHNSHRRLWGICPLAPKETRRGAGTLENAVMSEMAKQSVRHNKEGALGGR